MILHIAGSIRVCVAWDSLAEPDGEVWTLLALLWRCARCNAYHVVFGRRHLCPTQQRHAEPYAAVHILPHPIFILNDDIVQYLFTPFRCAASLWEPRASYHPAWGL